MALHSKKLIKRSSPAKLRIIAGHWRGRLLPIPDVDGLRPTGSRIRETLFNWLTPHLTGSRCLDLFAGSGALGFEALSRGATHCTMIEQNPLAAEQLRANLQMLGAQSATIVQDDALSFLRQAPTQRYDVTFVDPPFSSNLWSDAIRLLEGGEWLSDNAFIYVETPARHPIEAATGWQLYRQKKAGQICFSVYRKETSAPTTG